MSQILIRKTFAALAPQAVKSKAEELARKMSTTYNLEWQWTSPTVVEFVGKRFPSKGVTGKLAVDGQNVSLTISLPLMLDALKGKIETEAKSIVDSIEAGR